MGVASVEMLNKYREINSLAETVFQQVVSD
jgi:hypothetical protein